jgi:putative multiple sugar transport system ATP-binding protein
MQDISKDFFGVKALSNVNFNVIEGEINAIVGENGAGKSTLMNILSGVYPYGQYSGHIFLSGQECTFSNIKDSEKNGIVIIHQELALSPYMTIAENVFLGNERAKYGIINWDATNIDAIKYLTMVSLHDEPTTLVKDIGIGKQQLLEIAKALAKNVRLLILDEPTAALNDNDSKYLLDLLCELKKQGVTLILISHKLNEVCDVADRITILRDGCVIETLDRETDVFSEQRIIQGMVGREMTERFPRRNANPGEVIFEVNNWNTYHPVFQEKKVVDNVSISVRKGEVVGIYGLMGAGRTEFVMSLFGRSYGCKSSGEVKKNGVVIDTKNVINAIHNKISLIPEDRKDNGLNLISDVKMNISIAALEKISKKGVIDNDKDLMVAREYCNRLHIKATSPAQKVESLSGGNQQKVVLAKWIFTEPEIFLLDEPTRGVDVGAKYEIYGIINQLVENGAGVVFISSDLTEVLGMSDRIYIMHEGKLLGEMPASEATQTNIMHCIVGNTHDTEVNIK